MTTNTYHEPKPRRKPVDWAAIERDYRSTQMTLRELETKYGVTNSAISQMAKAKGWSRDLLPAIKQATDARVIQESVNEVLRTQTEQATQELRNTVLIAAEINTNIILGHRKGLRDITLVRDQLLYQVAEAAANLPQLTALVEASRNPDEFGNDKTNDALKKALARSTLIDDLKKLAEVDERVRKGEREAFGIGEATTDDPLASLLKRIGNTGSAFKPVLVDPAYAIDDEDDEWGK